MSKRKDTEYLYISTLIRAKESRLLNLEQAERMIEAKDDDEVIRILEECGYHDIDVRDLVHLEHQLTQYTGDLFRELRSNAPDSELVDIFTIRYDYHNAKVLVKSEAAGTDAMRLMSSGGRIEPEQFADSYYKQNLSSLPQILADSVMEAKYTLARTGDAQAADIVLDCAYYQECLEMAKALDSDFLEGYFRLSIDSTNLKSAVRTVRNGMNPVLLDSILISGGNIPPRDIINCQGSGEALTELYRASALRAAAEGGKAVLEGGSMTTFERLCDNAMTSYLKKAKLVSFGEEPIIAYILAMEAQIGTVRIILSGRAAGLEPGTIRERLRESYV